MVATNSAKICIEVPEAEGRKCMVLAVENILEGKDLENGESKHDKNSSQPCIKTWFEESETKNFKAGGSIFAFVLNIE